MPEENLWRIKNNFLSSNQTKLQKLITALLPDLPELMKIIINPMKPKSNKA